MQAISYSERLGPDEEKRQLELRLFNAKTKEELQAAMDARGEEAAKHGGKVIMRAPIRAAAKRIRNGRIHRAAGIKETE